MRAFLTALCAVTALGCGVKRDLYAAKELEANQLRQQLVDEAGKSAALQTRLADTQERLAATSRELRAASQELAATRERQSQLEVRTAKLVEEKSALEARSSEYEQLTQSLQGQIAAGEVELSELKGRMTVKLRDRVLFPFGSARITRQGQLALDAVAEAFRGLRGKNVIVAGYTDDVPVSRRASYADNWELSTMRALAVVRYLQSKGVDPRILGASGFSEYRPVAPNDTEDGRSRNRRIEIVLTAADYTPPEVNVGK